MQVLAVFLALAVLAGCDARAVPATEDWQQKIELFYDKMVSITQQSTGMVQEIPNSQLMTQLETLMSESMTELARYRDDLQAKITETAPTQWPQDLQLLMDRLAKDLQDGRDHSIVYLTEIRSMVDQNTGNVQGRMESYLKKLRRRLNSDMDAFRRLVSEYAGEITSRAHQNMNAAQEQVQPYLDNTMESTNQKMSEVAAILRTQAEGLGQQLESQAEVLRTQLESTGQEMRTFLEGMVDRLTEELPSIATQLREKLEDIAEKVKETASA